jgi:hypothetical protein
MTSSIITILLMSLSADSLNQQTFLLKANYRKHLVISGIIGIGLGFVSGVCYTQGNNAYREYQNTTSMAEAVDYWEKTMRYDTIRNICAFGSVIFLARTFYYYYKLRNLPKSADSVDHSAIKIEYHSYGKWLFGFQKHL